MELHGLAESIRVRAVEGSSLIVALSGGVDSGLVAAAAHRSGLMAQAVTVVSEFTPDREREAARSVASYIGIPWKELTVSVLGDPLVKANDHNRCYHCKRMIFRYIRKEIGTAPLILDGTNGDDDPTRPGLRAVMEYGVFSPLLEAGMGKADVREMSRRAGLPNWNAPSESCLATRIPVGTPVTERALTQVAAMEAFFHRRGVETLRIRPDNLVAIVEHLPQYTEIMHQNHDKFMALVQEIGLQSCEFKEWRE